MANIFDGLEQICDEWLGVDDSWPGTVTPRYENQATLQRLFREERQDRDGQLLLNALSDQISKTWSHKPSRSKQNWRFEKQKSLGEINRSPEVTLERTITQITDKNWVNQVPTASGVDDSGSHDIDLVHREGKDFTFVELKVTANNPVSAAFQIIRYAMVYAFSRRNAEELGYAPAKLAILRSERVSYVVLAPQAFFTADSLEWLRRLETTLNSGLEKFFSEVLNVPSSFRFEAFPEWFEWKPQNCREESVRKDVLWALHQRRSLFSAEE